MIIPEPHLLALSESLSGKPSQTAQIPFLQSNYYQINANVWSCVLSQPGNDPWYFRPLESTLCEPKSNFGGSKTIPNPWSINQRLSEQVRISVQEIDIGRCANIPPDNFFVITSESFGAVLGTRCSSLQLVAKTLQTWGSPPQSVIQDWQNQLGKSTLPSTAETLVTEDGMLIPLSDVLKHLTRSGLERTAVAVPKLPQSTPFSSTPFSSPAPDWPHCRPTLESQVDFEPVTQSRHWSNSAGTLRRKRKTNSKWLPIGSVVAAITILTLSIWLINLDNSPPNEMIAVGNSAALGNDSDRGKNATAIEIQELTITGDPTMLNNDASVQQSELTVETLLAQLRPNKVGTLSLDSVSAASIISEALSPAEIGLPTLSADEAASDEAESNEATLPAALNTIQSESGRILLERPIRLQAAITKETVLVGMPVLAKASRCEIELKLVKNLVVEPAESVAIEGTGKATWRIAMEDEDPELVVEIWSKPGARWQIITAVGLREGPGAIPIWIGPREAQNIGNRLIDYRQWINNAIETLRTARSKPRGRTTIDFAGEIKKLEQQEREAEKAIERWKVIARLSHFFFDSNEVRLQFTAVAKP